MHQRFQIASLATAALAAVLLLPTQAIASPRGESQAQGIEFAQQTAAFATTTQITYRPDTPITIEFSGLPGNAQDWVTVVEASTPDDTYGEWFYTDGQRSGTHTFAGLAAGTYEVRTYFNWPDDGYLVRSRYRFTVGNAQAVGYTQQSDRQRSNQTITIQFSGLPGNEQDWITLVNASDPDDTYGEWFYTGGQRSGNHTFNGLPAGTYEVRVYFNWPDGGYVVQGRNRIIVD